MDADAYQEFRRRLDEQLSQRQSGAPWSVDLTDPLERRIVDVLGVAACTAQAVNECLVHGSVVDRNKYDFGLSMIERVLAFEQWVLAEYSYLLPGGARPGVRLLLEVGPVGRQIAVVLFEDTRRWRVDAAGHKIAYELLTLLLDQPEPVPHVAAESAEYFVTTWDWRQHLREALCLPVRLMA